MSTHEERYQKRRLRNSYITSVVTITLVLFLLGIQGVILIHAHKLSRYVLENIIVTAVLENHAEEADIVRLQRQLEFTSSVKSTEFISRDEAARILTAELGEDFVAFIGHNPLPATIEIRMRAAYANEDSIAILTEQLLRVSEVQDVFYQTNLVQLINDNIRRISLILLSISAIILLIAIALINNTIRLSVYSKRLLIKSMQLVGATQGFIRKPFIMRGLWQGLIGAFLSSVFIGVLLYRLQMHAPDIVSISELNWYLLLFAGIFVVALIFTWLSSYFAVRRFLKMGHDRVHY